MARLVVAKSIHFISEIIMSQFITTFDSTGNAETYCIEEGNSTFAGTAGHCEIKLSGESVEPIHCMFSTIDGKLTIQDWKTDGKTLLNGTAVLDESQFVEGDEVAIGDNRIVVGQLDGSSPAPAEVAQTTVSNATTLEVDLPAIADTTTPDSQHKDAELEQELERIRCENSKLETEFANTPDTDGSVDSLYDDPFSSGDTEFLRDEIESLTVELAERDQQISMFQQQLESGDVGGDMEDTARLVARMEQLLDELQLADERVRTHEELLRASDDATQAEQEERRQLEAWVEQIEDRVTDREAESKAETERLNNQSP